MANKVAFLTGCVGLSVMSPFPLFEPTSRSSATDAGCSPTMCLFVSPHRLFYLCQSLQVPRRHRTHLLTRTLTHTTVLAVRLEQLPYCPDYTCTSVSHTRDEMDRDGFILYDVRVQSQGSCSLLCSL